MVGLLAMTGSASLVGVWVYKQWGEKKQVRPKKDQRQDWWQTTWQRLQDQLWQPNHSVVPRNQPKAPAPTAAATVAPSPVSPGQHTEQAAAIRYGVRTSALALAVTTTGQLCYPPLQVAGLPLLVYMGIPAARRAYEQLEAEGRPDRALAETVVLAVCLVSGAYWISSLGFFLYHGGRELLTEKHSHTDFQQPAWSAPKTTHLWKEGTGAIVATASLRAGDQVILQSGEMAPADGLIVDGVAWLRPQAMTPISCGLRKSVGDRISATDIVSVGQICVQIIPST